MTLQRSDIASVAHHPRLNSLETGPLDRKNLERFAMDLAYWMAGGAREEVGALARVVSVVAARELREPRKRCVGRPLLAIEATARTVERLWPLLRVEEEEEQVRVDEAESATTNADDSATSGSAGGVGDGMSSDRVGAREVLDNLAASSGSADLDSLEKLAEVLERQFGDCTEPSDWETAAGEALSEATSVAMNGVLEADEGMGLLESFLPGVRWSSEPGRLHARMVTHIQRLAELLSQLEVLQKIADALGRTEEPEEKRWWDLGGGEEVVGVNMSGNVTLALPSEMGLLGDESTEDLFYQRWQERRLVSLELVGGGLDGSGKPQGRGPVIACVDTSGSMTGPAEAGAKALLLAICRRVLPQGRPVHLMAFGGPGELENLVLKKGHVGLEKLLHFLAMGFNGGTDFDTPLLYAMSLLEEQAWAKADVLVVTDGQCIPTPLVVEEVNAAKLKNGARIWSVVFGRNWEQGVGPFSDKVWTIDARNAALGLGFLRRL